VKTALQTGLMVLSAMIGAAAEQQKVAAVRPKTMRHAPFSQINEPLILDYTDKNQTDCEASVKKYIHAWSRDQVKWGVHNRCKNNRLVEIVFKKTDPCYENVKKTYVVGTDVFPGGGRGTIICTLEDGTGGVNSEVPYPYTVKGGDQDLDPEIDVQETPPPDLSRAQTVKRGGSRKQ